jgi:hypothetical protein
MAIKDSDWNIWIGFWLGIAVLTLISIARTALNQTLYQYDWYILIFSIAMLTIIIILKSRWIKQQP